MNQLITTRTHLAIHLLCSLMLLFCLSTLAETPGNNEKVDYDELLIIDDFPSPYDVSDLDLEALLWKPEGEGPFPAIIMMHGSGGLYYKSDDMCADDDRDCWGVSGKFRYWGKQLSRSNFLGIAENFIVIAPDSHTPRGYDHFGVTNIDPGDRPLNVSSYLGRPWDLYATLRYLQTRNDVIADQIYALGFSDGGGGVVSSVSASLQAPLVDQSLWFDGINTLIESGWQEMQQLGLKGVVAYYPSCGFFGFYDNDYLNYAPLLIQTGLEDSSTPISECQDRQSEALLHGVSSIDFQVLGFANMDHGFDYQQYETQEACEASVNTLRFFSSQNGDFLFADSFDSVCN